MSSNTETLDKLATPIYQRNANKRYYENNKQKVLEKTKRI